jgi:hypothetical protein
MSTLVQEFAASSCAPLSTATAFPFDSGSFAAITNQMMTGLGNQPLLLEPGLWALAAFALARMIRGILGRRESEARMEESWTSRWQTPETFEGPVMPRRPTLPRNHKRRVGRPLNDQPAAA